MKNGNLTQFLKGENKLNEFQKYNILLDICNGMIFLHSLSTPIIHRGMYLHFNINRFKNTKYFIK
jgi:serine/threonine protein kinase